MKIIDKIVTSKIQPTQTNVVWHNPKTGELRMFGEKGWALLNNVSSKLLTGLNSYIKELVTFQPEDKYDWYSLALSKLLKPNLFDCINISNSGVFTNIYFPIHEFLGIPGTAFYIQFLDFNDPSASNSGCWGVYNVYEEGGKKLYKGICLNPNNMSIYYITFLNELHEGLNTEVTPINVLQEKGEHIGLAYISIDSVFVGDTIIYGAIAKIQDMLNGANSPDDLIPYPIIALKKMKLENTEETSAFLKSQIVEIMGIPSDFININPLYETSLGGLYKINIEIEEEKEEFSVILSPNGLLESYLIPQVEAITSAYNTNVGLGSVNHFLFKLLWDSSLRVKNNMVKFSAPIKWVNNLPEFSDTISLVVQVSVLNGVGICNTINYE